MCTRYLHSILFIEKHSYIRSWFLSFVKAHFTDGHSKGTEGATWAGHRIQELRKLAALTEDQVPAWHPYAASQPSVTPVVGDLTSSIDFCGYQACACYVHKYIQT